MVWGGANGIMFLFALAFLLLISAIDRTDAFGLLLHVLLSLVYSLLQLLFGSMLAFPIGAAFGILFAGIDVFLMKISQRLFLACTEKNQSERRIGGA